MAIRITGTEMTSDVTRHTARFRERAAADGSGAWIVSWLLGRLLTQNQAVTAMTIAEVAACPGAHDAGRLALHMDGWAAELGLTGPRAAALASQAPDGGEPCPTPWCETDHGLTGSPLCAGALSAVLLGSGEIILSGVGQAQEGGRPIAMIGLLPDGGEQLRLPPVPLLAVGAADAGRLAALLEMLAGASPEEIRELAQLVRISFEAAGR